MGAEINSAAGDVEIPSNDRTWSAIQKGGPDPRIEVWDEDWETQLGTLPVGTSIEAINELAIAYHRGFNLGIVVGKSRLAMDLRELIGAATKTDNSR